MHCEIYSTMRNHSNMCPPGVSCFAIVTKALQRIPQPPGQGYKGSGFHRIIPSVREGKKKLRDSH